MAPDASWLATVRQHVVELPLSRKLRLMREYQLPAPDAQAFVWDPPLGDYFETMGRTARNPKTVANRVINNLRARMAEAGTGLAELKFKPDAILELIDLVDGGKISSKIAQDVFGQMFEDGVYQPETRTGSGFVQDQLHRPTRRR